MPDPDKPKRQRNTTELPISVAIEKLRELYIERQTEQDKLLEEMTKKLYDRFDEKVRRVLLRVPEEFREHVTNKSGWGGEIEPSRSDDVNDDVVQGTEPGQGTDDFPEEPSVASPDDGIPERLKAEVPKPRPGERLEIARGERKGAR